jgi:hypothetical protein
MSSRTLSLPLLALGLMLAARDASACGGVVSPPTELVLQNQQRVLISYRSTGTSHIVLQLGIPSADAEFGALTPVYGQPTLDSEPVDVSELDELDSRTRPTVSEASDSGGGCGCGSAEKAGDRSGGNSLGGVNVIQIVDIGPVTGAVLEATDTAPLGTWLTDNGFVVPSSDQSIVDSYVGAGRYFIAFKRSSAAGAGPTSVGVSFTVPGDQRGYPLRMSRLGASDRLAIQVFVAAPDSMAPKGSGPTNPFEALTLADFSPSELESDYTSAIFAKVQAKGGKAFVVEGVYHPSNHWREPLGPRLSEITDADQNLTRLATVLPPSALTEDAMFVSDAPDDVPTHLGELSAPGRGGRPYRLLYVALLGSVLVSWLLRNRGTHRARRQSLSVDFAR